LNNKFKAKINCRCQNLQFQTLSRINLTSKGVKINSTPIESILTLPKLKPNINKIKFFFFFYQNGLMARNLPLKVNKYGCSGCESRLIHILCNVCTKRIKFTKTEKSFFLYSNRNNNYRKHLFECSLMTGMSFFFTMILIQNFHRRLVLTDLYRRTCGHTM